MELEELKSILNAKNDTELASKLGLDRSAIAQWKRRGGVPKRYHFLVDMKPNEKFEDMMLATKRLVYGDGTGSYLMQVALGLLPAERFEQPEILSIGNVGYFREESALVAVKFVADICDEIFGHRDCRTEDQYFRLLKEVELPHRKSTFDQLL